jgi:hypothetical protein
MITARFKTNIGHPDGCVSESKRSEAKAGKSGGRSFMVSKCHTEYGNAESVKREDYFLISFFGPDDSSLVEITGITLAEILEIALQSVALDRAVFETLPGEAAA